MKILLVDDHAVVRAGLRRLLSGRPNTVICEAAAGREALGVLRAEKPDLVLLDLNLPGLGGFELLQRIKVERPEVRVVVLSMHGEAVYATRALRAGADGYLSKSVSPEELLEAVRRVGDGGRYVEADIAQTLALQTAEGGGTGDKLTERDQEIMRLLAEGSGLADIADALGVSYKTVANTCSLIKAKLGVTRTADLIRLAVERRVPD